MIKPNVSVWFEEKWRDDNDEPMILTIYKCHACDHSFESAFGGYKKCPFCGRKLVFEEGVKP